MKPVGILGGTFDPVHYGHLRLAEEMLELLRLEEIRFIPAGNPPHRNSPGVSAMDRCEMVRLAISDHPAFLLDAREAAKNGKCYTVDTLRELRGEFGKDQPLCLLMGIDAFLQFHTWHEWEAIPELAHIAVGYRPGYAFDAGSMEQKLYEHYRKRLCGIDRIREKPSGGIIDLAIPRLEISATMIRERVAEKRSIRYLVPDPVANYIHQHNLYTSC